MIGYERVIIDMVLYNKVILCMLNYVYMKEYCFVQYIPYSEKVVLQNI